jgi:hypothetical protein
MALRLRRGTNAERLTITPVESELIYTTDTKELWIGDGVTVGGNKIGGLIPQFLSDLNDVDTDSSIQIGQVLKWNGNNWVASDDDNTGVIEDEDYRINILGFNNEIIVDSSTNTFTGTFVGDGSGLTNLPIALDGSGIVEGSNYRINIIDDGSTVMVNTSTGTFTGNFVGDGSGLTNLPSIFDLNDVFSFTPPDPGDILTFDGFNFVPQKIRQIEGSDSTVILDATTNTFTGNFVGDGSGLTNLPSIFELNDVFVFTPPDPGDILTFDGVNFIPRKIREIEGADSTIILDARTNTFTGNFVGDGSGLIDVISINGIVEGSNYRINIIGDDSTTIVNTEINEVTATTGRFNQFIIDPDVTPEIEFISEGIDQTDVVINTIDNFGRLFFYRTSDTDISGSNLRYGQILFGSDDINGRTESAIISSNRDFIWMGHRTGGSIQNEDIMFMTNGDTGFGTITPQAKVDINGSLIARGNATITGTITAASFNGSLVTDDSTTIIDAIDGSITAQSFVQFGSLTATERDTLNASNGMVIYNTTANRFQGYQNGAWINLDDGSAA